MIQKLAIVTIVVKDQAKALEFYTKEPGFEKRTDFTPQGNQRWVTVGPKGQDVEMSLFQVGSISDPKAPQNEWEPGRTPTWTFRTDDCRKDFEELKSRGVKFNETQPVEYPWGLVATFSDPDGNNFSPLQQPAARTS
ncbi:MAG TPA: VOC family protein [Nitrososphaerales archaeon]|nr:VOC family protein [Nitrososphaerales archaeon]